MHRLAVSICANSFLVSALTLAACAPETAPAAKSSGTSSASTTQWKPASNAEVNNSAQAPIEAPFVMRMSPVGMAGGPAAMQASSGQADAGEPAPPARAPTAGAPAGPAVMGGAAGAQAGAAAPTTGVADCAALSTCCAALTNPRDRENCLEVVERDDAERCARAREPACQAAGMPPAPTESCMKLSTCCATLPLQPQQRECQEEVMRANDERCTRQLLRTCPELGPPPSEAACVPLVSCCPMLTEPRSLELCRRALQEDDERDCVEAAMAFCQ
jgi:hypothetical protein